MKNKKIRIAIAVFAAFALLAGIFTIGVNIKVYTAAKPYILTEEQAAELDNVDCALVLGCGVRPDGTPSHMLEDRILGGIALYENNCVPKILMSGDHGRDGYDEVNAMKTYALDYGIDGTDIFMDHAGFSTYESMYRAQAVFEVQKVIIVTQKYHLYRAVYIARQLGMDAYGVASDPRSYTGRLQREIREILARVKDFGMCIFKPEPTYLGDVIPIMGDGNLTND